MIGPGDRRGGGAGRVGVTQGGGQGDPAVPTGAPGNRLLHTYFNKYLQYFVQLRYLQTLNSISVEQSSTIIFPFPISITGNDLGLKERTD